MAAEGVSRPTTNEEDSSARVYVSAIPYVKAALVVWFAEIVIGTLPLAAHLLITFTIDLPKGVAQFHEFGFLPEECIVIVVISGLALVTVFEFDPRPEPLKNEPTTCFVLLAALVSVMFSSMFYGFATAEIVLRSQSVVHSFLGTAIAASLAVAVRKAHGERDAAATELNEGLARGLAEPHGNANIVGNSAVESVEPSAATGGSADSAP